VQETVDGYSAGKHLKKPKILDLYMNLIYMGGNYYGVEAASKAYFGKSVKDLSLAQCASLAGITNMPGWYAPTSEENKKKNKKRQETILYEMKEAGDITEAEYQKAIKEDLKFVDKSKISTKASSSQSYFIDQVVSDVKKDLVATGMSPQAASKMIYNNGLKIYTTMDSDLQKAMDEVFTNEKYFPIVNKKLEHPQAAMVIIDPATGQVKALRGGYGQKTIDLSLNRATQIHRPPGSTFKPIAVYGPAVDQGQITAATIIDDIPTYLNGVSKGRYPQNYDKGSYGGLTTIHNAIINSTNVVAAKTWVKLGIDFSLKYLKRDGITLDKKNDRTVSIAMGGLYSGVNTLDMAAAYVPFVNNGKYIQPSTYTKVEDKNGNVILEKKPKSNIVYDNEGTSYVMTNMLKDVLISGTAKGYGLQNGKMPTAGKTGTTGDNRDKWFVGYTPYYVGATWYGYDKNDTLSSAEYSQALIIWKAVMEKAHANLQPKQFPEPKGTVKKAVCRYSGKSPSDLCSRDPRGNAVIEELFVKGYEPKENDVCDVHVLASVCKDSNDGSKKSLLFGNNCPATSMLEQVFTQRKLLIVPVQPNDPYPADWLYELPAGKYCNVHGSQSPATGSETGTGETVEPTESPGDTGDNTDINIPVDSINNAVDDIISN
jgi:penicillin-binding protein 1A